MNLFFLFSGKDWPLQINPLVKVGAGDADDGVPGGDWEARATDALFGHLAGIGSGAGSGEPVVSTAATSMLSAYHSVCWFAC